MFCCVPLSTHVFVVCALADSIINILCLVLRNEVDVFVLRNEG